MGDVVEFGGGLEGRLLLKGVAVHQYSGGAVENFFHGFRHNRNTSLVGRVLRVAAVEQKLNVKEFKAE